MLLISLAVALAGCDSDATKCEINSDCPPGELCLDGVCGVECREARDCPHGQLCTAGRCEPLYENNCSNDTDCHVGETCVSGVCQTIDATIDAPVPDTSAPDTREDTPEAIDVPDTLQDTSNSEVDSADSRDDVLDFTPLEDLDIAVDTVPLDTVSPPDTLDTLDTADAGCVPRDGIYGETCECAAQCISELCIGNPRTGVGMCTQECVNRSQCSGGQHACIRLDAATKVCAVDDTGTSCTNAGTDPSQCIFQTCIASAGAAANPADICSIPCEGASDCLPDHACSPVVCRDMTGTEGFLQCMPTLVPYESTQREVILANYPLPGRFCVPVGQANACNTDADAIACFSAICDPSPPVCSAQCLDPVDCPAGTCIAFDTSDPRIPIGYCDF